MKPIHLAISATFTAIASPALALDCDQGLRTYSDLNGPLCIPEAPQRVVSLHDLTITLGLLELGGSDILVGSHGRADDAGKITMAAAVQLQQGVTFDNSDVVFVGTWDAPDYEAIASLEPDLILARASNADQMDRLSLIAPTVTLNHEKPFIEYLGEIAEITNLDANYDALQTTYEARVADIKAQISDPAALSVAMLYVEPDYLYVYYDFYALSQAMWDVGLQPAPAVMDYFSDFEDFYDHASGKDLTAELLGMVDADFLLLPYWTLRADGSETFAWTGDKPGAVFVRDALNATVPGYCDFLKSCTVGQMISFEATGVYSGSFAALHAALDFIETHMIERDPSDIVN